MTTLSDGTVQISPLSVGIDNNTLGQEVVGSNLGFDPDGALALVNALGQRELQLRHHDRGR